MAYIEYVAEEQIPEADRVGDRDNILRIHGFDDRSIHDICSITAYFAFVNRIADGLGVELEPDSGAA